MMADREAIKKAILEAAGNPVSGVIVENVDRFADAVVALDVPRREVKRDVDTREKRVVEVVERR
jgi:hypothetical protein